MDLMEIYVIDDDFTLDVVEEDAYCEEPPQSVPPKPDKANQEEDSKTEGSLPSKSHIEEKKPRTRHKKFPCSRCLFVARSRHSLLCHQASHNINGPFRCDCGFSAEVKQMLTYHIIKQCNSHNRRIFECAECNFKTIKATYLKKHMVKHHG